MIAALVHHTRLERLHAIRIKRQMQSTGMKGPESAALLQNGLASTDLQRNLHLCPRKWNEAACNALQHL
jgi:hypothetical protein